MKILNDETSNMYLRKESYVECRNVNRKPDKYTFLNTVTLFIGELSSNFIKYDDCKFHRNRITTFLNYRNIS
jgi:hypothetical protein